MVPHKTGLFSVLTYWQSQPTNIKLGAVIGGFVLIILVLVIFLLCDRFNKIPCYRYDQEKSRERTKYVKIL